MKKLNVLAGVELFEGISIKDTLSILNCLRASIKKYAKGEFLLLAGDPVPSAGIVLDGEIQIIKEDFDGNRSAIAQMGSGRLFAEALASAQCAYSPVTVAALTECTVLWIDIGRITSLCEKTCEHHARLASNMLRILAQRCMRLNDKLDILSMRTTRGRLMAYLNEEARIAKGSRFTIPLNRIALADYLCVDRSAMTRELSRMQAEGLVKFRKNQFELL